jgi:hypothetical protein
VPSDRENVGRNLLRNLAGIWESFLLGSALNLSHLS